jgi:hypothetical protein
VIGDNKYLNNLKKNTNPDKPLIQINIGRREEAKSSSGSKKFFGNQSSSSKKPFAKNLFSNFNEERFEEEADVEEGQLPRIPEKMSEYDPISKDMENENSNPVSRLLDFESEGSPESEEEVRALSQESEETFHTPTKNSPQIESTNHKLNQFSTMTMKKEPKSKLFTIFSNSTDTHITDRSSMEIKAENSGLRKADKQKPTSSRFIQDYDVLEVTDSVDNFKWLGTWKWLLWYCLSMPKQT